MFSCYCAFIMVLWVELGVNGKTETHCGVACIWATRNATPAWGLVGNILVRGWYYIIGPTQVHTQPVAEVLEYLRVQISSISCRVIDSIPTMPGKTLRTKNKKSPIWELKRLIWGAWFASLATYGILKFHWDVNKIHPWKKTWAWLGN